MDSHSKVSLKSYKVNKAEPYKRQKVSYGHDNLEVIGKVSTVKPSSC